MITNTNFPVFAANQVLKNDHLNDLVNYLEEQTRLTRSKTIGIGILCGFQMEWTRANDNLGRSWNSLKLTEGLGITSSGYLIHSPETSFSHQRRYLKTMELSQLEEFMATSDFYRDRFNHYRDLADIYEFFKDESGQDIEELYELIPVENNKDNTQPISKTFLNNKVLLVYLNCDLQSLKNCDINDCDDKGAKLQFEIRYLLAPEPIAKKIQEREKAKMTSAHMPAHLIDRPYTELNEVKLDKLDFFASPPLLHRHVFDQYNTRIYTATNALITEFKNTFNAFNFLLKDVYSSESKELMISKLESIIEKAKSLNGNSRYQIQYYYDFIANLIDAYHEFLSLARQYNNICHFGNQLFPKHLMLGKLSHIDKNLLRDNEFARRSPFINTGEGFFPNLEDKIPYRHRFISSPQNALQQDIAYKMQTQHVKLYEMLTRFNPNLITKKPIAILPSKDASYVLSNRDVIPGYFSISNNETSPQHKLKRLWSYQKTLKGQLHQILSYHIPQNHQELRHRQTSSNFYRIEGHIGQNLESAITSVKNLRASLGLDFEIKLLDMADTITSKSIGGLPVNLFNSEIKQHPGLLPMSGVPKGGTFYITFETITTRSSVLTFTDQLALGNSYINALGSLSNNMQLFKKGQLFITELSNVTNKPEVHSEELYQEFKYSMEQPQYKELKNTNIFDILNKEIERVVVNPDNVNENKVVTGDFALSYVCCESDFDRLSMGVLECRFPWIDNYQFLNKYSWEGNTKDYAFQILEYRIGDTNIIDAPERITIKLASIAHQKLMAILQAINLKYPTGLVLSTDKKNKSYFTIKHFQNQPFKLKISRVGTNDTYTYTEKERLKNGRPIYNSKSDCKLLPRKYNGTDYKYLHQEFAFTEEFVYEKPPTNDDQMTWKKMIGKRKITKQEELPKQILKQLHEIQNFIVENVDQQAVIGLGGSWKSGSWVTKETLKQEKEFVAMREKITGKTNISDLDIIIQSDSKVEPQELLNEFQMENLNIIGIENFDPKEYILIQKR